MNTSFVTPTLTPDVAQTNDYLTELMARCAPLPLRDVVKLLNAAYAERWALGFEPCAQFVERLPDYVERNLISSVQAKLTAPGGLLARFVHKMQLAEGWLENRIFWGVELRQKLEERRQQLIEWAENARQGGRESDSGRLLKDVAYIERVLIGLDAKEASDTPGNFCLSVDELDAWCPPVLTDSTAGDEPQQHLDAPAVEADEWAGLLINYTVAELNNLLVYVGLLETAKPLAVADDTKPRQWVAIVAALKKAKRTKADRAALHRAFVKTYGAAVGSLSGFQREHNEANELAQKCFNRALSRLTQS